MIAGFPLAESWNGKTWTVKPTPNPKGATNSNLYAVSCISASTCMAVGAYEDAAAPTGTPFTEAWNGKTWTIKTAPGPKGGSNSSLSGVSCISAKVCVAVGYTIIGNNNNAFSELWNGKDWTIKTTPRPSGTTYSDLGDISCRSATFCMATGDYQVNNSSKSRTLAEAWNGKAWTIKATPNPKDGVNGDGIPGVACSSPRACLAVGGYGSPLAEAWNGKAWTITASSPKGAAGGNLAGVSCIAANACMAVGNNSGNGIFAETWNGRTWTIKAVPSPKGAALTLLSSVSCGGRMPASPLASPAAQRHSGSKARLPRRGTARPGRSRPSPRKPEDASRLRAGTTAKSPGVARSDALP